MLVVQLQLGCENCHSSLVPDSLKWYCVSTRSYQIWHSLLQNDPKLLKDFIKFSLWRVDEKSITDFSGPVKHAILFRLCRCITLGKNWKLRHETVVMITCLSRHERKSPADEFLPMCWAQRQIYRNLMRKSSRYTQFEIETRNCVPWRLEMEIFQFHYQSCLCGQWVRWQMCN